MTSIIAVTVPKNGFQPQLKNGCSHRCRWYDSKRGGGVQTVKTPPLVLLNIRKARKKSTGEGFIPLSPTQNTPPSTANIVFLKKKTHRTFRTTFIHYYYYWARRYVRLNDVFSYRFRRPVAKLESIRVHSSRAVPVNEPLAKYDNCWFFRHGRNTNRRRGLPGPVFPVAV